METLTPEERAQVVIATKWLPLPTPRNPFLFTPGLVSGLKRSLARLGVDSVDLYQVRRFQSSRLGTTQLTLTACRSDSWADRLSQLGEPGSRAGRVCQARSLQGRCVQSRSSTQGEIVLTHSPALPPLAVGVSNFSLDQVVTMHRLLASHGVPLASNQIEVNLLRQSPFKNGLIDKMNELGVVGLAYSPLAQGRLTGKYSVRPGSNPPPPSGHPRTYSIPALRQAENLPPSGRRFSNIPMAEIDPLVAEMRKIATDRGVSVSAIAINWVLSKGLVPLGGAKNAEQAEQVRRGSSVRLIPRNPADDLLSVGPRRMPKVGNLRLLSLDQASD